MPVHLIVLVILGGLVGWVVHRPRPLLFGLVGVFVTVLVVGNILRFLAPHFRWSLAPYLVLLLLLTTALAGATLRQWSARAAEALRRPKSPST